MKNSMNKVLVDFKISVTGTRYVVMGNLSKSSARGKDLRTGQELLSGLIMSQEIDMITKNSTPISANGLFQDAVMAFINDDEQVVINEVCNELRNWKEQFQSYTYTSGVRRIPNLAVNRWGEIAELEAVSEGGNAYYGSAEATLLLSGRGQVLTDIDAFYIQALADEFKKNSLVYCKEYTREYLRELVDAE